MAKQALGIGAAANDNTGDTLRDGGDKINDNFNEIYSAIGNGTDLNVAVANPALNQVLKYTSNNRFEPADYNTLTSALDVNNNSIISSGNGNITIAPNGTGDLIFTVGTVTSTFDSGGSFIDLPAKVKYKNQYTLIGDAPTAASYPGYFFTVNGDDNPYVNINITAGGAGNVRAKVATQYSSIDLLSDVDTTTAAPTANQVLKWNTTSSKWVPADDDAGISSVNIFATVTGDSGTTTANSQTDTLTIAGGTDITTAVSGDTLTVNFSGTIPTTFAALTDTDMATGQFTTPVQGDSLFWNGTDWVVTRSPITWWEINANGSSDFTFQGPGFPSTANDPTIYVHRGFTYAFDNSVQGGAHPFRIQSTQGLAGNPYTAGQAGSGTNVLYWTVPMDSPNTLYYQCTIHAAMNGTINVVT